VIANVFVLNEKNCTGTFSIVVPILVTVPVRFSGLRSFFMRAHFMNCTGTLSHQRLFLRSKFL
jgi:hypothetical protein